MNSKDDISAIVLAGGASRRMGQDKRRILLNGKTLSSYSITLAKYFCREIIISANDQLEDFTPYKIVKDFKQGAGPVPAIISSLPVVQNQAALVITCDMPFMNKEIIKILLEKQKENTISLFAAPGQFYPFPSIFPVSLLTQIREIYENGSNSMKSILAKIPSTEIAIPEYGSPYAFLNINRPEDHEKASKLFSFLPDYQRK